MVLVTEADLNHVVDKFLAEVRKGTEMDKRVAKDARQDDEPATMTLDRDLVDRWVDLDDVDANRKLNQRIVACVLVSLDGWKHTPPETVLAYLRQRISGHLEDFGV